MFYSVRRQDSSVSTTAGYYSKSKLKKKKNNRSNWNMTIKRRYNKGIKVVPKQQPNNVRERVTHHMEWTTGWLNYNK